MIYSNSNIITTESTSTNTAKTDKIILNQTDQVRTYFEANLIKNPQNPACCVSGKLVHERKKKSDTKFPTDTISKINLKVGDGISLSLNTTETKLLFEGLKDRYELFSSKQISMGRNRYTKVDESTDEILTKLQELKASGKLSNKQIIQFMEVLSTLLGNNISDEFTQQISNVQSTLNLHRLLSVKKELFNMGNERREEKWQDFLKNNQWLLSLIFNVPVTFFQSKAYLGGKGLSNKGGKVVDFIYKNNLTENVALIEIKTPFTKLINQEYREGVYSMSEDLSGGVNQLLTYKQTLLSSYRSLCDVNANVFDPQCILIIGTMKQLSKNDGTLVSFELYRNSLRNITILTFDELFYKLDHLITLLKIK